MDMDGVRLTELVEAAGCAAKLAPGSLSKVLGDLPRVADERLLVGFDASDDACVYDLGDGRRSPRDHGRLELGASGLVALAGLLSGDDALLLRLDVSHVRFLSNISVREAS